MRASAVAAPSRRPGTAAGSVSSRAGSPSLAAARHSHRLPARVTRRVVVRAAGDSGGQPPPEREAAPSSSRPRRAPLLHQRLRQQASNAVPGPHPLAEPKGLTDQDESAHTVQGQPVASEASQQQLVRTEAVGGRVAADSSTLCSASGAATPSSAAALMAGKAGQLQGLHKPVGMVVGSAWLLATSVQLTGVASLAPLWLPVLAGGVLGGLYSAVHHHVGERRLWRAPAAPLRVVIAGGSTGIGKALAREFLRCGDSVVVASSSSARVQRAVEQLREEAGRGADVTGFECDISDATSVDRLAAAAQGRLGGVDVWINCAGYSGSYQSLLHQPAELLERVVRTNLLGTLLGSRSAMRCMAGQRSGGHVFNLEGAGSDGLPTPMYAAYGATKAGIKQLQRTLQHEAAALPGPGPVSVHSLSPGMVLTDLLLEGATLRSKQAFNILCEQPETVAAYLVPRARTAVARGRRGAAIRYLTPLRVLAKLAAAPLNAGRYFDQQGEPVYPPERERILGERAARRTRRLQRAAAQRGLALQLAYSASMAASFFLIVSNAIASAPGSGLGH